MTVLDPLATGQRRSPAWRRALERAGSVPTTVFRLIALGIAALLSVLIIVPLLVVAVRELFTGGSPFTEIWRDGKALDVLTTTALAVGSSTVLATLLGSVFAWLIERTDATLGRIGGFLPVLPMLVPPLAGAIGWVLLASPGPGAINVVIRDVASWVGVALDGDGPLNIYSWPGLIFVYTLYLVPHVFLTVSAALRNLDPSLEEASRVCGAGTLRTLLRVTLPAVAPAIAGGALLALIFGIALYSVPVLIGVQSGIDVLAVVIVRLMTFSFPPETGQAMAYGVLMVLVVGTALFAQTRLLKAGRATIGGKAARPSVVELGRWRPVARLVMLGYVVAASVLPLIALVIVSFQPFWTASLNLENWSLDSYRDVFTSGRGTASALRNSLSLAVVGASVAMLLSAIIAFASRRVSPVTSRSIQAVTKLPGAFSHVVIAVAFISAFVGPPFQLQGTLMLLGLGYLVVYLPQASVSAEAAMGQIGGELLEASASSGASDFRTFRKIAAPLMLPGLTAGWVFVFVLIIGDVTLSVLLASNKAPVVGFIMIDLFGNGTYPLLASMGVLISAVSSAVVLGVMTLSRGNRAGVAP